MFMAPRLTTFFGAGMPDGLIEANPSDGISVAVLFDHEEIGSRSKNGANGNLLSYTLERICNALNISRENFLQSLVHSYYLSLDVAHAIHPAHPEKSDITSAMPLNRGFAIKASAKHAYCSDDDMTGVILQLAAVIILPASKIICAMTIQAAVPSAQWSPQIFRCAVPISVFQFMQCTLPWKLRE